MTAKTKPPTCPWPKSQVKIMVKSAVDAMGGQRAFDYRGRGEQICIIRSAAWDAMMTAATYNPIEIDSKTMWAIESAFRGAAGIVDDDT